MSARTGEPTLAAVASWLVLGASFGLSASTWIALADLAGFTGSVGPAGLAVDLAWLMPVAVDGYVVVALLLWMAPVPVRVARFARSNTYAAASVGVLAQAAYHALSVYSATGEVWRLVMAAVVGALPPAVAALAVHMRALLVRQAGTGTHDAQREPVAVMVPPVEPPFPQASGPDAPAVVPEPMPEPPAEVETAPVPRRPARKAAQPATPKRSFAVTQQAAASMEAGGMAVPDIAAALGISERQVRKALTPVPVAGSSPASRG